MRLRLQQLCRLLQLSLHPCQILWLHSQPRLRLRPQHLSCRILWPVMQQPMLQQLLKRLHPPQSQKHLLQLLRSSTSHHLMRLKLLPKHRRLPQQWLCHLR